MPSLPFGVYDPLSSIPDDVVATLAYECPPGQIIQIQLSTGSSGTYAYRTLVHTSGTSTLRYNVFLDAARTQIWGDGTGASTNNGTFQTDKGGKANTAYLYGRIFALQNVPVGSYADTIQVTIQF